MALSMVWYITDVDEDSGGTFVVPQSHRDPRNPASTRANACLFVMSGSTFERSSLAVAALASRWDVCDGTDSRKFTGILRVLPGL